MSYNGSGVYTLPGSQLVNGEVVSASENNQFRNDVATALNTAWTRDGQAPATGDIPMGTHKFTGLSAGTEAGDSVRYEQATSDVAITGGSIDGNVVISVSNVIESTSGGFKFPDGTVQQTSTTPISLQDVFTATDTYTVPAGIQTVRAYAFGAGGNGVAVATGSGAAGGGGGGCAFGDIPVSGGDTVNITISAGVATVEVNGTTYLTANPGANGSGTTGGTGGTATKDVAVTNGGAYTGGTGGSTYAGGGGSAASPLGNGYNGGAGAANSAGAGGGAGGAGGSGTYASGGGGAGGAGVSGGGGGGSGSSGTANAGGLGRYDNNQFSDILMQGCVSAGGSGQVLLSAPNNSRIAGASASPGGGGGGAHVTSAGTSASAYAGNGGAFGGGGSAYSDTNIAYGGDGGFGGGGGGARARDYQANGGDGGYGGGGGGAVGGTTYTAGVGGGAIVLIYV